MRRLLRQPAPEEAGPRDPGADPGDAVLLAQLDRSRTAEWLRLGELVRGWAVEEEDVVWSLKPGVMPYPVYGERVTTVCELLASLGAVTPRYHWMAFPLPPLSREETYRPGDAVRAATAVVRGERFGDGTIGAAHFDGTLQAIAAALVAWYQEQ
ncbi:DUF6508 domain-containing protein [Kitasatospora sp. McL0602]|uniref:DUF6508 domain-containing protein n=1 Tax=Kitasatospora sp. McL0602 TaxID=3439530 RepID=UPI003F88BDBA